MIAGTRCYRAAIRQWIEASDFNGTGCRHSQDTIAAAVGCDKRTVIREIREWEAEGTLTVDRGPRGSKTCNVYRVHNRCPQLRRPVLTRLAELRKNRRGPICHSKGTSGARALHVAPTPSSWPQFETNNGFVPNRESATWPKHRTSGRRALCEKCAALTDENEKLTEEVSGHLHTLRRQSRDIGRLKRELDAWQFNPDGSESKEANLVRRTITYWHQKLGKGEGVKIVLSGTRAAAVRQAIRWGWDTVPELKAIVDGLALAPYEVYGTRRSTGAPSSRKDDLTHAMKSEYAIETLIALAAPHVRPGDQTSMNGDQS